MDRKTDILDSAETLVRTRGFDGFSYADIEREVGIRKASIHHHFASKAELSLALITRYRDRVGQALADLNRGDRSAGERLSGYLDIYKAALSGGDTVCLCVAYSAGRDSLSDDVLLQLNAFHKDSITWLTTVFTAAQSDGTIAAVSIPRNDATACLALVEGAQLIARAAKNMKGFNAAVSGLRARIN